MLVEALEPRRLLATFTVTNTNDAGAGSFRQAVFDANASPTDDDIAFSLSFATAQSIYLQSGAPQFSASGGGLSINGPGPDLLTIRRNPASGTPAMRILDSLAPTLSLSGFTVGGGFASNTGGAGLRASGNVTLQDMNFAGNQTVGFPAGREGGGIYMNSGAFLTVRDTTFNGNYASGGEGGGAIYFSDGGSLLMERCMVFNSATAGTLGGGGILFLGTASATPPAGFTPGTLVIRNSTFTDDRSNTSGGGGIALANFGGTLLLENCTVARNTASGTGPGHGGGGIARVSGTGTITLVNTVVAANSNAIAPDIYLNGPINVDVNANYSLIGVADTVGFSATSSNNLTGTSAAPLDPRLAPYARFGGPTLSVPPQPQSPLINAGSNALTTMATDQRGYGRIDGPSVDIGAFEAHGYAVVAPDLADPGKRSFYVRGTSPSDSLVVTRFGTGFQVSITTTWGSQPSYGASTSVITGSIYLDGLGGGDDLSVNDAAVVVTGDQHLTTLGINGAGMLNMRTHSLTIDYTGASPYATIRGYVVTGRNTAASGIVTTPGAGDTVMAVVDNAVFGRTQWNGQPIDDTTIIGVYTFFGDANLDGRVTGDDYLAVDSNLGVSPGTRQWFQGDFNFDGAVTGDDYLAIDTNLGDGTSNPLAYAEERDEMIALHASSLGGKRYLKKLGTFTSGRYRIGR